MKTSSLFVSLLCQHFFDLCSKRLAKTGMGFGIHMHAVGGRCFSVLGCIEEFPAVSIGHSLVGICQLHRPLHGIVTQHITEQGVVFIGGIYPNGGGEQYLRGITSHWGDLQNIGVAVETEGNSTGSQAEPDLQIVGTQHNDDYIQRGLGIAARAEILNAAKATFHQIVKNGNPAVM